MAPRLPHAKLAMIQDMISSKSLTTSEMAKAAECSKRSIINISNNLRWFGNVKAPQTRVGRRRTVTPSMLEALCDHLLEKPGLYVDEMAIFLWDEFRVQVTNSSLKRALASVGWSKKVARQRAKEQNADLRDFYLHNLSDFQSHHLVYVDESGCDKRIGFRRTGWSPLGVTPLQVANFHRDQRYQILPAYCQDGIVLSRVFQGSTDATLFADFIEQLLRHCGRWPEPKSVIVMDNASFHRSDRIEEMCSDAGVKLVYLPPYSPDLNPIEEFFSELKAFIKRNWVHYEEDTKQGFQTFLEWCIEVVGSRKQSALGHFRHAGVVIGQGD
ncbi:Putative Transposase [Penicillium brasilianum]|uniref:Putative Transposase n=1 Tax=Penicillium brasilianum TaxID=104259 RepID=A0A0F7U213_PENBI|nr:Putative Transposase [Penicillium brasilianum]